MNRVKITWDENSDHVLQIHIDMARNRENTGLNDVKRTCYTLKADTKEHVIKWARCIQLYVDLAKGGDGTQMIDPRDPKEAQKGKSSNTWETQLEGHMNAITQLEEHMNAIIKLQESVESSTDNIVSDNGCCNSVRSSDVSSFSCSEDSPRYGDEDRSYSPSENGTLGEDSDEDSDEEKDTDNDYNIKTTQLQKITSSSSNNGRPGCSYGFRKATDGNRSENLKPDLYDLSSSLYKDSYKLLEHETFQEDGSFGSDSSGNESWVSLYSATMDVDIFETYDPNNLNGDDGSDDSSIIEGIISDPLDLNVTMKAKKKPSALELKVAPKPPLNQSILSEIKTAHNTARRVSGYSHNVIDDDDDDDDDSNGSSSMGSVSPFGHSRRTVVPFHYGFVINNVSNDSNSEINGVFKKKNDDKDDDILDLKLNRLENEFAKVKMQRKRPAAPVMSSQKNREKNKPNQNV